MFVWRSATRLPSVIVMMEMTASSGIHASRKIGSAVSVTRSRTAKPTAFGPTERNAVTGVGAPSYASGAHWWNGTSEILKPKPASTSANETSATDRTDGSTVFEKVAVISARLSEPLMP